MGWNRLCIPAHFLTHARSLNLNGMHQVNTPLQVPLKKLESERVNKRAEFSGQFSWGAGVVSGSPFYRAFVENFLAA
jgi:hypothetical protein